MPRPNLAFALVALVLAACGGGHSGALPAGVGTLVQLTPPGNASITGDDWTTFAHDFARTSVQAQPVGFDRTTVMQLQPAWTFHAPAAIRASPIVTGGNVYIATLGGSVIALDSTSGRQIWRTDLGGEIAMTPTYADGMIFVSSWLAPATFYALNALNGSIRWSRTSIGAMRSEPVVVSGTVYMGISGGDPPACAQGGVVAYDEATGATKWTWTVVSRSGDGGSVWSPIAWDGVRLYVGTGNTCNEQAPTADAEVALTPDGHPAWDISDVDSRSDDDVGGGALLLGTQLAVTLKEGDLAIIDAGSGHVLAKRPTPSVDGFGGIGTPSTDGTTLIASAGYASDPTTNAIPGGTLLGYDAGLNEKWRIPTSKPVNGAVAIAGGLAFTALDQNIVALDPSTGTRLWSAPLSSTAYPSPTVVPSGVYVADDVGDVTVYRMPTQNAAAKRRVVR